MQRVETRCYKIIGANGPYTKIKTILLNYDENKGRSPGKYCNNGL